MRRILITSTELMMLQFLLPHVDNLIDYGFQVEIACSNVGNRIDEVLNYFKNRVPVHQVELCRSPLSLKNSRGFFQLKKIIDKGRYNLIWTNEPVMGMMTRLAAGKYRRNGLKVIYMVHGFHFYKGAPFINWMLYYTVEKFMALYTDSIVTINREDYYRAKNFGIKSVYYIPGIGFNTKKFLHASDSRIEKRKELGIPENSFVVLSIGELGKRKNHEIIIKAIAQCEETDIYYILCGEGRLESALKDLAKKHSIHNRVIFTGYRKDIVEICGCADVMAHPSRREGLGIAALEGMASGLPIICSYINGIKDYTKNGMTGVCINNPLDVTAFKQAILKYYYNHHMIEKVKQYNIKHIKKFDLENVKNKVYKIIEEQI